MAVRMVGNSEDLGGAIASGAVGVLFLLVAAVGATQGSALVGATAAFAGLAFLYRAATATS